MIRAGWIFLVLGGLIAAGWSETPSTTAPAEAVSGQVERYRQAYREGFQPPAKVTDEAKRMRELIEKINRMSLPEYQPEPTTSRFGMKPKPKPSAPPKKAASQPASKLAPPPPEVLSTQTLQELARRVPESVADPIRLGDALYRSGHCTQALFIYQNALQEAKESEDQLWLYYQMGCCLKDEKPAEARKYYQKVRTTAPESSWAELASIQLQLVDWTERNQPTQFLDDLHRDLQPQNHERIESRQTQPRTGEEKHPTGLGTLGSSRRVAPTPPAVEDETTPTDAETTDEKPETSVPSPNEQ